MPSIDSSIFHAISDQEIEWACSVMRLPPDAFCGADGNDPRLGVMRSLETFDVEACPGSGKTTLLVAKLAILANRWQSRRQGICVLSHTNAARIEIGDRLSSTSAGHILLRHPHFVGTIHSFVNEFLAIPWLRSKRWPIKAIDTQIALADRWHRLPWGTRDYLVRQHNSPADLSYMRADFTGGGKNKYPSHTATYKQMLSACQESTAEGYYCFDEMFIWATEFLDRFPDAAETIRNRFPLVFIDEVQDNSELQSIFLHRLLIDGENPVVRQRFGDSNQAIYHRSGASGAVTDVFPGGNKADLPNSFRFGQIIADTAAPLGVCPQALVGLGPSTSRIKHSDMYKNTLFLFDETSVLDVLPAYARHLINTFPSEILAQGDFTAVAGVHRSDKTDRLPRFIGHYAPNYNPDVGGKQPKPDSFEQYIALARLQIASSRNIAPIVNCCAEGILHFIREVGGQPSAVYRKSASRYLIELLPNEETRQKYNNLIEFMISARCEISQGEWSDYVMPTVREIGEAITDRQLTGARAVDFLKWASGDTSDRSAVSQSKMTNLYCYPNDEPKVSIRLGSIHSVKGETHTATLVLESFHKTHHLKKLIPWLVGKRPKANSDNIGEDDALKERLKLHYVAMTRPSHLLCLAMRKDTLSDAELKRLQKENWLIIECGSA